MLSIWFVGRSRRHAPPSKPSTSHILVASGPSKIGLSLIGHGTRSQGEGDGVFPWSTKGCTTEDPGPVPFGAAVHPTTTARTTPKPSHQNRVRTSPPTFPVFRPSR